MRLMRWTHLLLALGLAGCAPPPADIDTVAEGYVRVSLQLAQHDPSLVDDWRGDEAWRPGPRVPVTTLQDTVVRLQEQLTRVPPSPPAARRRYLAAQLRALRFAARRLLGDAAGLDAQAREEFGIELSPFEPEQMANVRAAIDRELPGAGSTLERVGALRMGTLVASDRRHAVVEVAVSACRRAAAAAFSLPPGERVTIAFTPGLGWDGYARYAGGHRTDIQINDDGILDVARALRLACHEGYPGHHVQHLLLEQLGWPELKLSPGFGPHLLFAEGAAEAGADLAFSLGERARLYLDELMPAAALPPANAHALAEIDRLIAELHPVVTDVARQYLDGTLSRERAVERLRQEALIVNGEGTLALIERRRARALVYGEGRRAVYSRLATRDLAGLAALLPSAIALQ